MDKLKPDENKYDFNGIFEVLKTHWPIAEIKIRGLYFDFVVLRKQRDALSAKVAELQARPATFIKLDETTEAFQQTHAALECLKSFQKDHRELLERFHRCKQEYVKELSAAKLIADTLVGVNEQLSETNAKMERYENALKIIADDIDLDTHISKKKIAREALGDL